MIYALLGLLNALNFLYDAIAAQPPTHVIYMDPRWLALIPPTYVGLRLTMAVPGRWNW